MPRLCIRPGCETPGVVAYGIHPAGQLFWLATIDDPDDAHVLCERHSSRLTVPRGWVLDDRREEQPRLFQVPPVRTVAPEATLSANADPS
jgi:hypothetical protein